MNTAIYAHGYDDVAEKQSDDKSRIEVGPRTEEGGCYIELTDASGPGVESGCVVFSPEDVQALILALEEYAP